MLGQDNDEMEKNKIKIKKSMPGKWDSNWSEISITKWMLEKNGTMCTEYWGENDYGTQILCQIKLSQEWGQN